MGDDSNRLPDINDSGEGSRFKPKMSPPPIPENKESKDSAKMRLNTLVNERLDDNMASSPIHTQTDVNLRDSTYYAGMDAPMPINGLSMEFKGGLDAGFRSKTLAGERSINDNNRY